MTILKDLPLIGAIQYRLFFRSLAVVLTSAVLELGALQFRDQNCKGTQIVNSLRLCGYPFTWVFFLPEIAFDLRHQLLMGDGL